MEQGQETSLSIDARQATGSIEIESVALRGAIEQSRGAWAV
jgi:hypothetical protein